MKKIIVVIMILFACLSSEAQKFLRYQMNNNTYNGFYTKEIENILHDYKNGIATTFVHTSGKVYEIPINDIDSISFENVNISNGDVGQYRIYELNYEAGNVKKIYVDNRASLFASHNGDFGANDTILFSSAYNNIACLFYTDDLGRIKKIFNGEKLFYVDYNNEDCKIIDLYDTSYVQINSINSYSSCHSLKSSTRQGALFNFFFKQLGNYNTAENFLFGTYQGLLNYSLSNFAQNIYDVSENPEAHHQLIIVDALSIAGDLVGIGAALFGEIASLGLTTASVALNVGLFYNDLTGLVTHIWPDLEQMQKFRDYYQNKYDINVWNLSPDNVSYTSATLQGGVTSNEKIKGTFSFWLYDYDTCDVTVPGVISKENLDTCTITGNATNLKPGATYVYRLQYTCIVDGLKLVYDAESIPFTTLPLNVYTGEVQSKSSDKAEVTCQFYNVPEEAICGVEYSCNDEKTEERADSVHEGVNCFTLAPLKPNTTYTYQAFVIIDGVYVYAKEVKKFTTDSNDYLECPDENHPHWIDLGLPSGTLWSCCNVGASSPEGYGEYLTFDQITSAPSKEQLEELIENTFYNVNVRNGVIGVEFHSRKNYQEDYHSRIFLPAAGEVNSVDDIYGYYDVGNMGYYWSSTSESRYSGWDIPRVVCYFLFFRTDYEYYGSTSVWCLDIFSKFNNGVYSDPVKRPLRQVYKNSE